MSTILSADALNDFIAPSLECIKPVESLPPQPPGELTVSHDNAPTLDKKTAAQISLTDCLACSGCVTSSEAVLISLQSHNEVLSALGEHTEKTFVALVSPQTRAALAVALGKGEREVGRMVERLLVEKVAEVKGKGFSHVLDTNLFREVALEYAAQEVLDAVAEPDRKKPILTSACPGFICYLESTHPTLLPHLSRLKSPQAIGGTWVKSTLKATGAVSKASDVYVVAVMPCFDKKLEGARGELTAGEWSDEAGVRDVDCVITTRELLSLCSEINVDFSQIPDSPLENHPAFPLEQQLRFLLPSRPNGDAETGTSGGTLQRVLRRLQAQHPEAEVKITPGRNVDTRDYTLLSPDGKTIAKLSRCYGFRNIQNLVRRLKPAPVRRLPGSTVVKRTARREEVLPVYTEVMACPGGCTNGGGQIKVDDEEVWGAAKPAGQKELLAKVDEAYFSGAEENGGEAGEEEGRKEEESRKRVGEAVGEWEKVTGLKRDALLYTRYRVVENDVGKRLGEEEVLQVASRAEAW